MFIIDCGDIGPSYQPGHTHCDFLSYELMVANLRLIVDTGVCEYDPGPSRKYCRSTEAHNTVSVDGGEQSEIWGEFRVARRAEKIDAKITSDKGVISFCGSYRGFHSITHQIQHQRSVAISLSEDRERIASLVVTDDVRGDGFRTAESFIHFHPEITAHPSGNGEIRLRRGNSEIALIKLASGQAYRLTPGVYCPEFGKQIPNQVLVLEVRGELPLSFGYEIRTDIF
jgi:uncharacterized heparinase superfamily protein